MNPKYAVLTQTLTSALLLMFLCVESSIATAGPTMQKRVAARHRELSKLGAIGGKDHEIELKDGSIVKMVQTPALCNDDINKPCDAQIDYCEPATYSLARIMPDGHIIWDKVYLENTTTKPEEACNPYTSQGNLGGISIKTHLDELATRLNLYTLPDDTAVLLAAEDIKKPLFWINTENGNPVGRYPYQVRVMDANRLLKIKKEIRFELEQKYSGTDAEFIIAPEFFKHLEAIVFHSNKTRTQ